MTGGKPIIAGDPMHARPLSLPPRRLAVRASRRPLPMCDRGSAAKPQCQPSAAPRADSVHAVPCLELDDARFLARGGRTSVRQPMLSLPGQVCVGRPDRSASRAAQMEKHRTGVRRYKAISPAPLPCLPVTGGGTSGPLRSIATLSCYRWTSPLPRSSLSSRQ